MNDLIKLSAGDVAPLHNKAYDSLQYCYSCGRKLGKNPFYFEVDASWVLINPLDQDETNVESQGCFPVGVECAKKFESSLLVKIGG